MSIFYILFGSNVASGSTSLHSFIHSFYCFAGRLFRQTSTIILLLLWLSAIGRAGTSSSFAISSILFTMHLLKAFALATMACLAGRSLAIVVTPGDSDDLVITANNTINGTSPNAPRGMVKVRANTGKLPLSIINNFADGAVNVYITGKDANNKVVVLKQDGTFYYPDPAGAKTPTLITQNLAIPLGGRGSATRITIPAYVSSARIWFAAGNLKFYCFSQPDGGVAFVEPSAVNPSDPSAGVNWGFIELTWIPSGIWANISYVDFVGLPLGMSLTASDGSVQTAKGLKAGAINNICNELKSQAASDGQPWDQLCMTTSGGTPLRVLSPNDYISIVPNGFSSYYNSYIDSVWTKYASSALTLDTQAQAGKVSCQVSGSVLKCNGDNRSYSKPTVKDIFGCNSGPFLIDGSDNDVHRAVVPRLCAGLERSTLLLNGGDVQPGLRAFSYYTTSPTNHFSRIVHAYEVDGKGYTFSYDDVNPDGENQSGLVSAGEPTLLSITVGGP